jgi:hypothetical protein
LFVLFFKEIIMKTSRIAALALIASASVGFNAFADTTSDNYPLTSPQNAVSTLTRAQVQAEAVQANLESFQRGFQSERGEYLISSPAASTTPVLTREAVRAEAIRARGEQTLNDNAG